MDDSTLIFICVFSKFLSREKAENTYRVQFSLE